MTLFSFLNIHPAFFIFFASLLGLLVGSFLNVVIYRLPIMIQRTWKKDCLEYLEMEPENEIERFDLILPNSSCPVCKAEIKAWQNIPVVSYILLGGKCGHCKTPISLRYPVIEVLTGVLSGLVAWHFGFAWQALFALLFTWSLIALSGIDIDEQLLPDAITLPVLWLGLFLSLFGLYTDSNDSIIGAIAGYLILWSVYQLFKLLTGKEGMGYGDFKLLALFGAWLGWQFLPQIILVSSLVGALIGGSMILFKQHDQNKPIPFGPYLAVAGWIALIWGDRINQIYLDLAGL